MKSILVQSLTFISSDRKSFSQQIYQQSFTSNFHSFFPTFSSTFVNNLELVYFRIRLSVFVWRFSTILSLFYSLMHLFWWKTHSNRNEVEMICQKKGLNKLDPFIVLQTMISVAIFQFHTTFVTTISNFHYSISRLFLY